ncbi:hypothetical protein GH733_017176 [Mirounga leonina]|nr:hypothetical protein GH733_017176 [Mirounga leonina]
MTLNVWTFNCVASLISPHDVLHGAHCQRLCQVQDLGAVDSVILGLPLTACVTKSKATEL